MYYQFIICKPFKDYSIQHWNLYILAD